MRDSKHFFEKNIVVCLVAMVCCILWGSAAPCIKISYGLLQMEAGDSSSQILFAGIRFVLAGLMVIGIGSLLKGQLLVPRKASWGKIVLLGCIQTVAQYICYYIGVAHTTGVKAAIITASNVFLSILVSSLLFHYEKLTVQKLIGCLIGFAGVVLINLNGTGLDLRMSFLGEGMVFLAALSYSFSSAFMKHFSQEEEPVVLSGYQFVVGGAVMILAGVLTRGQIHAMTPKAGALLLYLALVSAVAYSLWGILLKCNPVGKVAVYGFLNPVCGVFLAVLLLHESSEVLGLRGLGALLLVCGGIYAVNRE